MPTEPQVAGDCSSLELGPHHFFFPFLMENTSGFQIALKTYDLQEPSLVPLVSLPLSLVMHACAFPERSLSLHFVI